MRKTSDLQHLNPTRLKIELLCEGARTNESFDKGRKAGAGPAGGRYFTLPNQTCVEIPLQGEFVKKSPFTLVQTDGRWQILRRDVPLTEVKPVPTPHFYSKTTLDSTPMSKIALLHGKDCLASSVYSRCIHWSKKSQCKFCAIELGPHDRLVQKQPHQLAEVAEEASNEGVAKHVTLTTGTPPGSDRGAHILAQATKAIKEHINMPVHVQLEPSQDTQYLETLYQAGVDTVGIHVESFDPKVLHDICPAKASIQDHFNAWKKAVRMFGEGQVSTFVIAGLGETNESILQGAKKAAGIGVIPYLLPLRPIAKTPFEQAAPPTPQRMIRLYRGVAEILHEFGLDPDKNKAGCVRCGACSALQEAFHSPP